jgi:hypothetical protein
MYLFMYLSSLHLSTNIRVNAQHPASHISLLPTLLPSVTPILTLCALSLQSVDKNVDSIKSYQLHNYILGRINREISYPATNYKEQDYLILPHILVTCRRVLDS